MADERRGPAFPGTMTTAYHDGVLGRMRSRSVGHRHAGVPELVLVQGLAVADYLLPGLGALGAWTRAHLVELPGYAGGADARHRPTVVGFGRAVMDWLDARRLGPVVLAGHSSGTQVAAEAAAGHPDVIGLVLAGPILDPSSRGLGRLVLRWLRDGRRERPGLVGVQRHEWRRSGPRRIIHLVQAHRGHRIEEPLTRLPVPLLVIRGRDDPIGTAGWARGLAALVPDGRYVEVAGAHTFPWRDPEAWSEPVRRFAIGLPRRQRPCDDRVGGAPPG